MKNKDRCLRAIFISVVMLAMRSLAGPGFPMLSISQETTNTVTIKVKNAPADTMEVLQMSTDLTGTNWMDLKSNFPAIDGVVTFTNIPATNACEFFRSAHAQDSPG
jgi:hypothetical protein